MNFTIALRWNSLLCPPLGFAFNFLLLWLILQRTPKEMRVHSRILLQTGVIDCLLLACQCFGQIVFIVDRKNACFVHFYDGYLVHQFNALQTQSFLVYFFALWIFFHNLSVFGIVIQFIYRYLVLNRNMKITLSQYLLLLFGIALYICANSTLVLLGSIATLNQQPIDRQRFGPFVDFKQPLLISYTTGIHGNHLMLIGVGGCALLNTLIYPTICVCSWKMVRFVSKNSTLTAHLRELNRQLTKNLIILACIPLFFTLISMMFSYDVYFGNTTIQDSADWTLEWELYFLLTFHWIPVLNLVVTIYINRPYRDALIGRCFKIAPTANG